MIGMTVWPSGLRRWLQAPVREGVGSNPKVVTLFFIPEDTPDTYGQGQEKSDDSEGIRTPEKSGHPESNQGPSDCCNDLQSDALPTEL